MEFGIGTLHGGLEGRRYGAQNCKQAGNTPAPEPYAVFRLPCIPFMRGPWAHGTVALFGPRRQARIVRSGVKPRSAWKGGGDADDKIPVAIHPTLCYHGAVGIPPRFPRRIPAAAWEFPNGGERGRGFGEWTPGTLETRHDREGHAHADLC